MLMCYFAKRWGSETLGKLGKEIKLANLFN